MNTLAYPIATSLLGRTLINKEGKRATVEAMWLEERGTGLRPIPVVLVSTYEGELSTIYISSGDAMGWRLLTSRDT